MASQRLRILHAIHDFLPRHRAGSEIYAFRLARRLAEAHHVQVLCAEYDPTRRHGTLRWRWYEGVPVVELINNWAFASFDETYASSEIDRQLEHVLAAVQPDILHIHSLLNLSLELPAIARRRGIPSVATLHDYTLVCPSGGQRVHVAEQHICKVIDPDRCRRCFPQSAFHGQMLLGRALRDGRGAGALPRLIRMVQRRAPRLLRMLRSVADGVAGPPLTREDIVRRLERARNVFDAVEVFVAPSRALAQEFQHLGLPPHKIRVSDYGFPPLDSAPRPAGGRRLRIGFVGTLVWHKGVHVLLEAARQLPADTYEIRIYGDPTVFPDYVASLRTVARGLPVEFRGGFDVERAANVYREIDVLVVPSLWPENSPLVIHEAFMAGVPVVGARQGGIPELVNHDVNGLLYEAFSPAALAETLRALIDEPARLRRYVRAVTPVKSIDQDAYQWQALYRQVVEGFNGRGPDPAPVAAGDDDVRAPRVTPARPSMDP